MVLAKTFQNTGHAHKNQGSAFKHIAFFVEKTSKKQCFFWTSILEAFWDAFGRVWGRIGEPKPSMFGVFAMLFRRQILEGVLEGKKSRKTAKNQFCSTFWARPGGMCKARGRDREGVIRRSRPRLLKLSNLGLKIFGQDFALEFSTRRLPAVGQRITESAL